MTVTDRMSPPVSTLERVRRPPNPPFAPGWLRSGGGLVVLVLLLLLAAPGLWAQAYLVPGDPKAGMQVFAQKGCMRCHAVLGEGGRAAPDLARAPAGHLSSAEIVSAMWNHAPEMWQKMRLESVAVPRFTPVEMTDLFAFLYSVRSLDEPGDAERGRRLLSDKKCLECHTISGERPGGAPALKNWAGYRNPVSWIQAMWNHGPAMQTSIAQRGFEWPRFSGNDMPDLIASIRTSASNPNPRRLMRQADANRGRIVFAEKKCSECHSAKAGADRGPDLGHSELPRTLGQFAGLMWNHAPQMWSHMQTRGMTSPKFSDQEMADLLAFLFTSRYFDRAGDAGRGRRIFEEKGCAGCHTSGARSAPDLGKWRGAATAIPVATALWNHGPLMFTAMNQRRLEWPRFRPGEVGDLLEFLNRGSVVSPANGLVTKGQR